ncbi:hypothetical protein SBOR_1204 [Sclerotinia borealis F-4128]|uniref:Uncharacterized protein n=1 Tax=Sclerotinia borealis (strain F-4128) TaxID=1432307 RepID=W9CQT0_SCLBF|nr:hypothetical protein SBOR_1204 [Sclerotinia borealis F-4128]
MPSSLVSNNMILLFYLLWSFKFQAHNFQIISLEKYRLPITGAQLYVASPATEPKIHRFSMPRTHYVLWGNACEILSNVIFQSLSLDITPKSGFRRAVTTHFNHFHCFSRSIEPEEIIRRHHRNLPGRAVQIGRIRKGAHYRRFKEIVAEVEREKSVKCRTRHLYWISRVITKSCTNMGRDRKPDPIIEWSKSSALLEEYLFLRKTFPDPADFPYRKLGPAQSWKVVRGLHTGKEFLKRIGRRIDAFVPEDDNNGQRGPFDHDAMIIQPEPMTLHNDASTKAKEAEEKAKKAAEESDKKLERLLRRNRYKLERDDKKHQIKDKNPENPYAPARRDDEESIVTDSDFAGNYQDKNDEDDDPPPEKKARVHHRHREYVRASEGSDYPSSFDSDSGSSSMTSMYAPSVRRIYDKQGGHRSRHRGRGHRSRERMYASDVSSDAGRPPSLYSYPSPHHAGYRYG